MTSEWRGPAVITGLPIMTNGVDTTVCLRSAYSQVTVVVSRSKIELGPFYSLLIEVMLMTYFRCAQ